MRNITGLLSLSTLLLLPLFASAQVEWLNPEGKPALQLEFSEGSFEKFAYAESYSKLSFPTATIFLSGRAQLSRNLYGIVELSYFATKYEYYNDYFMSAPIRESHSGFANPYLGLELSRAGSSPLWNIGVRLPMISAKNALWAFPGQFISSHRFLAFTDDVIQVSSNWGYRYVSQSGFGYRLTLGGQLLIPENYDKELFGDFATSFWYQASNLRLLTGFSSLCLLTEDNIDFGDRLLSSLSMSADLVSGQIEPGVHLQIPVGDNLTDFINIVYGIHLSYNFGPSGN